MKRNIWTIIIVLAIFLSLVILLMTEHVKDVRSSVKQQEIYYSNVYYQVKGKMLNKELLVEYGSESKKVYLIEMSVDSIVLKKTLNADKDSLFFGVYSPADKKLYYISDFQPYPSKVNNGSDDMQNIIISSKNRSIMYSNGTCERIMIYGRQYEQLLNKITSETIIL